MAYVELKNGATIENAEIAIRTVEADEFGSNILASGGGIIKANGAILRNNKIAVQITPYQNFNPNNADQKLPNVCSFYNCTFETNDSYNTAMGFPYEFIGLFDVDGVKIYGNTFQNTSTSMNTSDRGRGIVSFDASFIADELYTSSLPNTFKGLYYGINSENIFS
ncbi:MAG: hypothetical protein AAB116_17980, partial [Candidatus Poribacteria bacterium]